jgi:ABC-type branched-subunit amino acid transport system ATPase component
MVIHILRSVYRKPDLLILDAVLEKLAASHLEKILEILSALKKTGASILCREKGNKRLWYGLPRGTDLIALGGFDPNPPF